MMYFPIHVRIVSLALTEPYRVANVFVEDHVLQKLHLAGYKISSDNEVENNFPRGTITLLSYIYVVPVVVED